MNLYLHIPFCASRCSYCDFYTQTGSRLRRDFLDALIRELHLRRVELPDGALIDHIYFGGGTPSLLTPEELTRIFDTITELYPLTGTGEVTIECNPDDVTEEYAQALGTLPINRVSMGVQSFHADDLTFLNRRHSAEQVFAAVEALRRHGIDNLSLDLIYGLPGQTEERWLTNILSLGVPHLSAYHLIYEEGTALTRLVERGKVQPVSEEASLRFFELLISELKAAGYEHYEISNFALPDRYARHNTGYWQGVPYLGLGPSAHSFDGLRTRSHNVAVHSSREGATTRPSTSATKSSSTSTSSRAFARSGASRSETMRHASVSVPSGNFYKPQANTSTEVNSPTAMIPFASLPKVSSSPTASSPTFSSKEAPAPQVLQRANERTYSSFHSPFGIYS